MDLAPDERERFLDRETRDPALRREVLSLLSHDAAAGPFFERALRCEAALLVSGLDAPAGLLIGRYRIVSLIGRGGMGAVYLAERADGEFEQRVALKLVQSSNPTATVISRFQQERQILAQLHHPGIATLLDGGTTADGLPYLVMEYVAGQPIDSYCEERSLDVRERTRLLLKVCMAVGYAHRNSIVHRDLKPANILVTVDAQPKLLDFGIAKILQPADESMAGASTQLLTPEYASPEQIRGDAITFAADIYSLGAVLHKLLTGRPPHAVANLSPLDAARTLADAEVPAVANLDKDLNAILSQALRSDPKRRYRSVEAFSDDLRSYLDGRPVKAMPDSWEHRAGRFVRRRRVAVFGAACCALLAVLLSTQARPRRSVPLHEPNRLHSIAVLPLRTLGEDRDQVLELGLADTLIARLSQLPELEVRSIETVRRYDGADRDPVQIGRALGVDAVLEGTMHPAGPGVRRINMRLVSTADGKARWSQSFDHTAGELLALEDNVSTATASALALVLTSAEDRKLSSRPTQDEEAFRDYLEGRFHLARRDAEGFDKAASLFESAVARDPNFAEAHAALAEVWMIRYDIKAPGGRASMVQRVRAEATRAVELKPWLASPYRALALVAENYDYDRRRTEELYRQAIQADPNDATSHHFYGEFLALTGRFPEAEREMRTAYRLDPVSLILQSDWARVAYFARRWDLARQRVDKVLDADPHFQRALTVRFIIDLEQRQFDAARALLPAIDEAPRPLLALLLAGAERKPADFEKFSRQVNERGDSVGGPIGFTYALAEAGRNREAIRRLEDIITRHLDVGGIGLEVEPFWDNLRDEPEFQRLMTRMGAVEPVEVRQWLAVRPRYKVTVSR